MSSPKTTIRIFDLSQSIPNLSGLSIGVVIPNAPFGSDSAEPIEVFDEDSFLKAFSPRGRVEVGYNLAYFSILTALKKNTSVVVKAVKKNALYGGTKIVSASKSFNFTLSLNEAVIGNELPANMFNGQAVTYGISGTNPTAITGLIVGNTYYLGVGSNNVQVKVYSNQTDAIAGTNPLSLTGGTGTQTFTLTNQSFVPTVYTATFTNTVNEAILSNSAMFNALVNGDAVVYTATTPMTNLVSGNTYYVRKTTTPNVKLYLTKADALADTNVIVLGGGTTPHNLTFTVVAGVSDPTAYQFKNYETDIIYQVNSGKWGENDIVVKLIDNSVKLADTFKVQVFRPENTNVPIDGEDFLCSRKHMQDGYGNQLFIEDVLKASNYIRALDNSVIADTVMPTTGTNVLYLMGGTNGDIITESDMILALDSFANKDSIKITLFLDGGWATAGYAGAIASLCATRQDCFGILSVPYSAEISANYITDIKAYADTLTPLMPDTVARYVAVYTSYQKITDKWNNRKIFISPDGFVGGVIGYTAFNFEIWYAPAGWENGGISAEAPLRKYSQGERDALYDANINCIRYDKVKGLAVWGNINRQKQNSNLNRINTMLLLVYLTPLFADYFDNQTFKFNTADERRKNMINVSQFMTGIKSRKGVTGFLMTDKTTTQMENNNQSRYVLGFKPIGVQEFINFDLVVIKQSDSIKTQLSLV